MSNKSAGYSFNKTLAAGFIDIALLLANISQIKILEKYPVTVKTVVLFVLVIASILLQITVGCVLIYLGNKECRSSLAAVSQNSLDGPGGVDGFDEIDGHFPEHKDDDAKGKETAMLEIENNNSNDDIDEQSHKNKGVNNKINMIAAPALKIGDDMLTATDEPDHVTVNIKDTSINLLYSSNAGEKNQFTKQTEIDKSSGEDNDKCDDCKHMDKVHNNHSAKNKWVTILIFIIMVINILISGIGIQQEHVQRIVSHNEHVVQRQIYNTTSF